MIGKWIGVAALLAIVSTPGTAAQTLQQRFDSAQASFEAKDWLSAAMGFAELLDGLSESDRKGPIGATILSRLGEAYARSNEDSDALAALEEADSIFESAGTNSDEAYVTAYLLGNVLEERGFLTAASISFERALSLAPRKGPLDPAAIAAARTQIFANPDRSRELLDAAIGAVTLQQEEESANDAFEDNLSRLLLLRGRVELNGGNPSLATSFYDRALKLRGKSTRVYVIDTRLRSEAAYAQFLLGDKLQGRKLLMLAGANRQSGTPSSKGEATVPDCGPTTGIRPEDMVVLDLTIADDMSVSSATPIYSSRPGQAEEAFAREILNMRWASPEKGTAEQKEFWRQSVHVELRCKIPYDRIDYARAIYERLSDRIDLPLRKQIDDPIGTARRSRAEAHRLARLKGDTDPAILPELVRMRATGSLDEEERAAISSQAQRIAEHAGWTIPDQAILWEMLSNGDTLLSEADEWLRRLATDKGSEAKQAVALILARRGEARERKEQDRDAIGDYARAVDISGPDDKLLQSFANLRLSALSMAQGDRQDARSFLTRSGLAPEQCSLLDSPPKAKTFPISSSDYPTTLLRAGFNGSSELNYEVSASGALLNPRVIFAFPPFIWTEPVESLSEKMSFEPVLRDGPDGMVCGGGAQVFKFEIRD